MGVKTRVKQISTVVGFLTILAGIAVLGLIVYLWWDSRGAAEEFEADTDYDAETDFETSSEFESDTEFGDEEDEDDVESEAGADGDADSAVSE